MCGLGSRRKLNVVLPIALTTLALHSLWLVRAAAAVVEGGDDLNPTARDFRAGYLPALNFHKAAEALKPKACAGSTLIHAGVGLCQARTEENKQMYIIPHAAIRHDGEKCGTGQKNEYMILVSGKQISDAKTATLNGFGPLYGVLSSNARARNAFQVLHGIDPVYVGFEYNAPRICGGKPVFEKHTIFIFIIPSPKSKDLNFGFAYLGVLEVGMVSVKIDEEICLYKESRRLGPGQKPFSSPTPSPSPGIDNALNPETLQLEDPAELEPCLPVQFIGNEPKPSVSPSPTKPLPTPSRSTSPTPSSTVSPSPTASPPASEASPGAVRPTLSGSPTPVSPSPSVTPSSTGSFSPSPNSPSTLVPICFPSDATVELSTGTRITIDQLQIGDKVLSAPGIYSSVFVFSHRLPAISSTFVQLTVRSNRSLALSPGHYIPVSGKLTTAEELQLGDTVLLESGKEDVIVSLRKVVLNGLYNPHTLEGRIVVNGIVASTFTKHVDPPVALALLAPLKLLYRCTPLRHSLGRFLSHGSRFFANLLPNGPTILTQFEVPI